MWIDGVERQTDTSTGSGSGSKRTPLEDWTHSPTPPVIFQDFQDQQESSFCLFQSCCAAHGSNSVTL